MKRNTTGFEGIRWSFYNVWLINIDLVVAAGSKEKREIERSKQSERETEKEQEKRISKRSIVVM